MITMIFPHTLDSESQDSEFTIGQPFNSHSCTAATTILTTCHDHPKSNLTLPASLVAIHRLSDINFEFNFYLLHPQLIAPVPSF